MGARWLSSVTRRRIRSPIDSSLRGSRIQHALAAACSVHDLNVKIRAFIDGWNANRAHPFVWTKTADAIAKKANVRRLQKRTTSLSPSQRAASTGVERADSVHRHRVGC